MIPIQLLIHAGVAIIFFAYWLVVFAILYHLTRFGVGTLPKKFAALFFFGTILLFGISIFLYTRLDFSSLHI